MKLPHSPKGHQKRSRKGALCGALKPHEQRSPREREWVYIGGDLEASFDGRRCVDIRSKARAGRGHAAKALVFLSREAIERILDLLP